MTRVKSVVLTLALDALGFPFGDPMEFSFSHFIQIRLTITLPIFAVVVKDVMRGTFNNQITGISVEALQGYMDAPNRSYKDYKSQEGIYRVGTKVMRLLGLELGGKR